MKIRMQNYKRGWDGSGRREARIQAWGRGLLGDVGISWSRDCVGEHVLGYLYMC